MSDKIALKNALISVYHKEGLEPIVRQLVRHGVNIYSTGGTQTYLEELGATVLRVEDLTGYPSILGGRVKTLHPKVFGGILGRRELADDLLQLDEYEIPQLDLVIVDLYPFEDTVASGAAEEDIIEKIDIGGISLIRAAAKNFKDVVIIPSKDQYTALGGILEHGAETTLAQRKAFATAAFAVSSHYDTAIHGHFSGGSFAHREVGTKVLRYGENPHQQGWFHGDMEALFDQVHGKELSYNNLLDIDAAVNLIADFTEPTFAILKHNNACGLASRATLAEAYGAALAGDPVSAFGGVLIANREVDAATATAMHDLFFEVIIAPSYSNDALEILKQKKNRVILIQKPCAFPDRQFRTLLNGVLEQDRDLSTQSASDMRPVTTEVPTQRELADLVFANKLVKHTKSNTIVLAKDGQLLASGCGMTSRVDALRFALTKAKSFGFDLNGAVMASDAFFPFPDCVEIAGNEGICAVVQPGGSIKDKDSIDYCNAHGIAMVMTGVRHFKH
ncbi:MAG: bifunctional phosphoribosylaminoimidazolecarboxamide formyltransferase/IMP cyclohydrolase [Flavobacteriales bacterium]|nr:bifunctional phosphoribosylaminoimidazolecarboxamide formyltransferase/IMP cyclohydrolase [Flavobacteriales bacterium]